MDIGLFEQLRHNAQSTELLVRVTAGVASAAATSIVERIENASQHASQAFITLMEPYWQAFQFYAEIEGELDRRCSERWAMLPYAAETNREMRDITMFGAVAEDIKGPRSEVRASALVRQDKQQASSGVEKLETALLVLELAAALHHDTLAFGHMIGPVVGLVLQVFERREPAVAQDAFSDTSQLLIQLEDVEKHLKRIAVGVYRVPDFWPQPMNLPIQRERRNCQTAETLRTTDPLTLKEAESAVLDALTKRRQRKLRATAQ